MVGARVHSTQLSLESQMATQQDREGVPEEKTKKEESQKALNDALQTSAPGKLESSHVNKMVDGNQDMLAKLMSGSGAGKLLTNVMIGIGFLQNFGTVMQIDIAWPVSFQDMFWWLEVFSFDFSIFGEEQFTSTISIFIGLLVSPWCIYVFDRSGEPIRG